MKRPEEKLEDHLGLFSSLSDQQVKAAEERATDRFRSAPVVTTAPAEQIVNRPAWRWRLGFAGVAAGVLLALFIGLQWRGDASAEFDDLASSRKIQFDEVVRSGSGGTLNLVDGSRVEMRAESELVLQRGADGVRIRLNKGDVIVNAAKQHGHLYVQTKDVMVSVVGTVFLVKAETEGSRVAVIEGEVRVQQGEMERKLLPGERVVTNPSMSSPPVKEEISWSRHAEEHFLLLQQSVVSVTPQNSAEGRVAFEVASIRPSDAVVFGGRGAGEGSTSVGPCKGSPPQIDPRQFVAINKTVYQLITFAYPIGVCPYVSLTNRLQGGPDWSRTNSFDIKALIPEGFPNFTWQQLRDGDAPKLQLMLRTMLEERFKLAIHSDMKEMSVYVLSLGKRSLKLMPSTLQGRGSSGMGPRIRDGQVSAGFNSSRMSMGGLASRLELVTGAPVLDRTGISGDFSVNIEFAPLDSGSGDFRVAGNTLPVTGPSVFTALEELGLELKLAREKVAVLVIDHVERPSEN